MKASQFITYLQNEIRKHGDSEIAVNLGITNEKGERILNELPAVVTTYQKDGTKRILII